MKKNVLLALMVWAIDVNALNLPIIKCWEEFQKTAWGIYRNFTDPSDEFLYCPDLVGKNYIDVMVDYTLCYAKALVTAGTKDYGKLNKLIKNYKG